MGRAEPIADLFRQVKKKAGQQTGTASQPMSDAFKEAQQNAAAAQNKNRYGKATTADIDSVTSGAHFANEGGMDGLAKKGAHVRGAWQRDAEEEGTSVLGLAGGHAIRGAAWGGVGGGTIEAMQGGDFFDGAKQGAVNGAVGWTGYRMAMRGTGANSLNPFAKGNSAGDGQGLFTAAGNVSRAYSKDADVAKTAQAILGNRQVEAAAQASMNTRKAKAADKKNR